jgi:hypothetical protein
MSAANETKAMKSAQAAIMAPALELRRDASMSSIIIISATACHQ